VVYVATGHTLSQIAHDNGCSVAALARVNGLRPNHVLQVGDRLVLPGFRRADVATTAGSAEPDADADADADAESQALSVDWGVPAETGVIHLQVDDHTSRIRLLDHEDRVFLEVQVTDASEFETMVEVTSVQVGRHRILRATGSSVPNAIAAFLLHVRNLDTQVPHVYFEWSEGSPFGHLARYVLVGEGDIAPVCHEVLRQAEPDAERRPRIHVG